ncbi:minor capsid protein [Pseudomonas phage MiCath]|uniref:Minor capsid protein n=1 Tax=Pseudomonas phage MiCath TaxID=3003729 RepID=A0AAF0AH00_9CAUD|nr:minor capsid protein [Pseudomonas phage MiCath]WAX22439.1 minor capsid protein [Pseudomonas phage MiCath]
MAETANDQFFDAMVRHQVYLLRYSGTVRNKLVKMLNDSEPAMVEKIRSRMDGTVRLTTEAQWRKFRKALNEVIVVRNDAWASVQREFEAELIALAEEEPKFIIGFLAAAVAVLLNMKSPPKAELNAIVKRQMTLGRTLTQWVENMRQSDVQRISAQLQAGVTQGDGPTALARRVVGTAAVGGSNGATEITRRNVAAVVPTVVTNVVNAARALTLGQKGAPVQRERFTAVLDHRTTILCASLDGSVYPIGVGPIPPLHVRCRSLRIAVIAANLMANEPLKPKVERQLIREFAEANSLVGVKSRTDLLRGAQKDFDAYVRKRLELLTGKANLPANYQEWLKRQSPKFQELVLGKAKAKLFRDGNLALKEFVDYGGQEMTLSQLSAIHREAFVAAGLDPDKY